MENILGERIKTERNLLGLTQDELAEKVNVSGKSVISNYEKGYSKPDLEILAKFTKIFKCSADYLLGLSKYKVPVENVTEEQSKYFSDKTEDKQDDDDIFDVQLAANMEAEYGKKPSPELIAVAKKVYRSVLKEIAEGKKK